MIAYYLNKNKRLQSIKQTKVNGKQGFNIPEEHMLLCVKNAKGEYYKPLSIDLSLMEELFLNTNRTSDYLGFIRHSEFKPAGFRLALNEKQYFYNDFESMGVLKFYPKNDGTTDNTGVINHELIAFGGNYIIDRFMSDGTVNQVKNYTADPWVFTKELYSKLVFHAYHRGNVAMAIIMDSAFMGGVPNDDVARSLEILNTPMYWGEEAKAKVLEHGVQAMGEPVEYGW